MIGMIHRTQVGERFLPPIGSDLYGPATDESTVGAASGQRLLNSATMVTGSWWKRHGLWLAPAERIERMFLLHQLAFVAEQEGRTRRADFFWREAQSALRHAWNRAADWEAVRAAVGDATLPLPEELRNAVASELFIDTHIAFANGRLALGTPLTVGDRAFAHVGWARELAQLCAIPPSELSALLAPALEAEIALLEGANLWAEAIARGEQLVAVAPNNVRLQNRLIILHFDRAVAELQTNQQGKELLTALALEHSINAIEAFRLVNPDNILAYEVLGRLHQLHSVQLANGGRFADALVSVARSRVFDPTLKVADETTSQLAENMRQLQAQMQKLEAQLRPSSQLHLNSEGQRLREEARRGFGPVEKYASSGEPGRIAAARGLAQAKQLWRDIGLPPAGTVGHNEQPLALMNIVSAVYGSEASTVEELVGALLPSCGEGGALAGINATQVADFIVRRRAENAGETSGPDHSADPPVDLQLNGADATLISTPTSSRSGVEPFLYWLFGSQDRGARYLTFATAGAVAMVLGIGIGDAVGSAARTRAYAALVDAAGRDDDRTVATQADRFLAAWTLRADDDRDDQVRRLQVEAAEAPNRRIRDTAAEHLRSALASVDRVAAIDAAAEFLGAPPVRQKDPRHDLVLETYARELALWFAESDGSLDAASRARVDAYRKLAGATELVGEPP